MNVIVYDEASMIKFVKCVEPFPVLYDSSHPYHHSRTKQNECWSQVAKEMGDDITLCRDKWKNVRASYTRYLRRLYSGTCTSKQYYLAQYLQYLTPFISFGRANMLKNSAIIKESNQHSTNPIGIDHDYHTDEYVKTIVSPIPALSTSNEVVLNMDKVVLKKRKRNESRSNFKSKRKTVDDSGHINFFKSVLPEVARMSRKEKLKFKQTVLNLIEETLYNSNKQTKQIIQ